MKCCFNFKGEISNTTLNIIDASPTDDVIVNYVEGADLYGYSGNDSIVSFADLTWAYGTDGNDTLANYAPGEYFNRYYGEAGNDVLLNYSSKGRFYGGRGDDILINFSTSSSEVELDGGDGADLIYDVGYGMATLGGGSFDGSDDTLVSGDGVDIFEINMWGGNDTIQNYKSHDIIVTYGEVSSWSTQIVGNDVILSYSGYFSSSTVYVQNGALTGINFFSYSDDAFESLVDTYKTILGIPLSSYDAASDETWSNANEFFGTAEADNIFVSRSDGNDLIFGTDSADTIHLYDTALSDIVATTVNDNSIAIAFNTGEVAMISAAENVSPTFKLASGESYVYNRETSSWQEA